jgi:hypothetical protein
MDDHDLGYLLLDEATLQVDDVGRHQVDAAG